MSTIQLLHGTDHIIEVPDINIGNPHNDYGRGFYCTRVEEMAREWACKKNTDGFVNVYDFDEDGLKVLNLLSGNHTVLNWIALLLQFRTFKLDSEVAVDARYASCNTIHRFTPFPRSGSCRAARPGCVPAPLCPFPDRKHFSFQAVSV